MRAWIIGLAVVAALGVAWLLVGQPRIERGERQCGEKCAADGKGYVYSRSSQPAGSERCICLGQPKTRR